MRLSALLIATLVLLPGAASAQNQVQCYNVEPGTGKTYLNMAMTQKYRIQQSYQDNALMSEMAGVWYGEVMSPQGNAVARNWYSYESNGLFQYQSETCDNIGTPCSKNYGTGEWSGTLMQDGSIAVMFSWSDLNVSSACAGWTGQRQGNMIQLVGGGALQRVQ